MQKTILLEIHNFLVLEVYPKINEIDNNADLLKKLFKMFCKAKFFRIYIEKEYGGEKLNLENKINYEEMMGQLGGAFGFLQAQSATALWLISKSLKEDLKKFYLTSVIEGNLTIGNALSNMKPQNQEKLKGDKLQKGYKVSGKINFVSGHDYFDKILVGFQTTDEKEIFALIPFHEIKIKNEITISKTLDVISMNSLNTVSVEFNEYYLNENQILIEWEKGYFYSQYRNFLPYAYPLGLANEALIQTEKLITTRKMTMLLDQHSQLKKSIHNYKNHLKNINKNDNIDLSFSNMIKISWNCIEFSILVCKGEGLLQTNNIQRIYRELPMWIIPRAYPEVLNNWLNLINN